MNPRQSETSMRSLISSIQLSKTDAVAGKVFYKQLFSFGTWANPLWWWDGEPTMELTRDLAEKMVANFNNNVLGSKVPVPRNHTDDVNANTGEVVKLEVDSDGLYGYMEIRDPQTIEDIKNELIFDVSIGFDWDYISQKDSTHYGPTLFHVALVNTPYINNMSGFTEAELARHNHEYAQPLSVAGKQSVIMMSIAKVEELKHMKFAKVTNDNAFPVDVNFTDADGKDQSHTIEPGAELEVPTTAQETVEKQITDAVEPTPAETDEEKTAREKQEADDTAAAEKETADKKAADEAAANGGTPPAPAPDADPNKAETPDEELARVKAENVELKANQAYETLLAKGKITPAQKDLFLSLAHTDPVKLAADLKTLKLTKGQSASAIVLMSAILEAGPQAVKFGEKGTTAAEGNVTLSDEDRKQLTKLGVNPETYMKQVADGKIKINVEEK